MKEIIPLAVRYGAGIIALAIGEKGIPKTKEDRLLIANKIIEYATKEGMKKEDILVDPVTLTKATNPEIEDVLLNSIKDIQGMGYKSILGLSNISHGMRDRARINNQFLRKASQKGLNMAIM